MEPELEEESPPVGGRVVLADRSIRALLVVTFASATAASLQATALGIRVYDLTGRKLDLGFLGLAEFAPSALLVLVTGSVADRFDRRRVAAIGLGAEIITALGLAWYARSDGTALWPIMVMVVAFGVARAFVAPATRSMPPNVAPPGWLPRVIAYYGASWQVASIVGPVMAGFLFAVRPSLAFIGTAVVLAVAIVACSQISFRGPARVPANGRPTLRSALEGLQFVRHSPVVLAAISLDLFAVLFGGAVALLPVIAKDRLHVGPAELGWLRGAGGIGAAVMALGLAARPIARHVGQTMLAMVAVFGLATVVLGVTRSLVVALVAMAVLNGADMMSVFIRATIVPLVTPDSKRGRVLAVESVFVGASNELGAFESGVAAQVVGTVGAVVSGGLATVAIVAIWWFRFPALRRIDRFSELTNDDS